MEAKVVQVKVVQVGGEPIEGFEPLIKDSLEEAIETAQALHEKHGWLPSGITRFVAVQEGPYAPEPPIRRAGKLADFEAWLYAGYLGSRGKWQLQLHRGASATDGLVMRFQAEECLFRACLARAQKLRA